MKLKCLMCGRVLDSSQFVSIYDHVKRRIVFFPICKECDELLERKNRTEKM